MPVPAKGDAARPDARLTPLLDYLVRLLAAECRRRAEADASASGGAPAPAGKDGSS